MSDGTAKKEDRRKFQAVRGTRDILPPESALWIRVEQAARDVFATYGFAEIRLPIFEQTELFARSVGMDTDIVSKEMYTFEDHTLPGFENDRDQLLAADIMDRDSLENFSTDLNVLVRRLKRVQAEGELDEETQAIVEQLDGLTRIDFDRLIKDPLNNFDELHNAIQEAKRLVEQIDLGNIVTLRPEATASVVRAYIQHSMHLLPGPLKLYYMGPMFRRERPQKGRYRQFYQIGAEVLSRGVSFATDAEVIAMLMNFLEVCGLSDHTLYINSIGCNDQECRPAYLAKLRVELLKVSTRLGPDSRRRIETNPLRVFDSKLEDEQDIIEKLPRISNHLCEHCRREYDGLKNVLQMRGIKFVENSRLVRGLDYYTQTTFEVTVPGAGAQNAICGGGRYDGLVELIGGVKFAGIKGVGFAVGEDRLIEAVKAAGKLEGIRPLEVYLAWFGKTSEKAQVLARLLRRSGFGVEVPDQEQRLKKSLSTASAKGATFALIIGEDEVASGQFTLKRLADGDQKKFGEGDLVAFLKSELKH